MPNSAQIECVHCKTVYSIPSPIMIGGIARTGVQVTTEVGCPNCQEQDGVIVEGWLNAPIDGSIKYLGSTENGEQYKFVTGDPLG